VEQDWTPLQGYVGKLAKSHEPRVHDSGGAHDLPHARGSHVPRTGREMRGLLCGIL
jgi:hypothetical protein